MEHSLLSSELTRRMTLEEKLMRSVYVGSSSMEEMVLSFKSVPFPFSLSILRHEID